MLPGAHISYIHNSTHVDLSVHKECKNTWQTFIQNIFALLWRFLSITIIILEMGPGMDATWERKGKVSGAQSRFRFEAFPFQKASKRHLSLKHQRESRNNSRSFTVIFKDYLVHLAKEVLKLTHAVVNPNVCSSQQIDILNEEKQSPQKDWPCNWRAIEFEIND